MIATLVAVAMNLIAPYELSFRWCGITHAVPSWLLKGMARETSGFDAAAHGPTNDWGLLQIIESNAPACGLTVAELALPKPNVCCASWLMDRNISRVASLRGGGGSDTLKIALYRNNMGGGNTDGHITSGMSWEDFKAATSSYPSKHAWVEKMWNTAQSYRFGEYLVNAAILGGVSLLVYALFAR